MNKSKQLSGYLRLSYQTNAKNHTIMVIDSVCSFWITLLTSVDPNLNEYRVSFDSGVNRYFTIEEFKGTPLEYLIPEINKLTDKIDEDKIMVYEKEFYTRP